MATEHILNKIEKIEEGTTLIVSYQGSLMQVLAEGNLDQKLSDLAPYIEVMNSIEADFVTMTPEIRARLQQAIGGLREALNALMQEVAGVRDQAISETQQLKTHQNSATAYMKADKGIGS